MDKAVKNVSLPPPPQDKSPDRSVVARPLFAEREESWEKLEVPVVALDAEPTKIGESGEDLVDELEVFEAFRPCRWDTARKGNGREVNDGSEGRLIGFVAESIDGPGAPIGGASLTAFELGEG